MKSSAPGRDPLEVQFFHEDDDDNDDNFLFIGE